MQENKTAVTGSRTKNFYNLPEVLTDCAKKFYNPHEILLRPARRNKIEVVIHALRFCFARYIEKICTKILQPHVKMNSFTRRFLNLYRIVQTTNSKMTKKYSKRPEKLIFFGPTVGARNVYAECGPRASHTLQHGLYMRVHPGMNIVLFI